MSKARRKTKPKPKTIEQRAADAATRLALEETQLKRQQIKLQKKIVSAQQEAALSTYQAAKRNRLTRDWRAPNVSGNAAILSDSATLIARGRQMVRDDPNAAAIKRSIRRNVVGTGITSTSTAKTEGGQLIPFFNDAADNDFSIWANDPKLCDIERRRTFAQIQSWAIGEVAEVGEALVIKSYVERRDAVGLVLQCVEAEQLDDDILAGEDGREVIGGVEVDDFGAAVAYHIRPRHPNDTRGFTRAGQWFRPDIRKPDQHDTRESDEKGTKTHFNQSVRLPAERVCHIFDAERARQARGVTRMSASLMKMRDASTFDEAQLIAAKAEACQGLIITSETPNPSGVTALKDGVSDGEDAHANEELALQPLMVARLQPGESITGFTPTRPGGQYAPFTNIQDRKIAAGAGLSYEQMTRDFSNGNFSSQRQTLLEDRREFEPLQQLLISALCAPIRNEFIFWAVIEGRLIAPGYAENQRRYNAADWRAQGWEWIDPAKQAAGIEKALAIGLTNKTDEANKLGKNYKSILAQRKLELEDELELKKIQADIDGLGGSVEMPDALPMPGAVTDNPEPAEVIDAVTKSEAGAETVVEGVKLNGAQITAALEIITSVINKTQPPNVAITLLISLGIVEADARAMVDEAIVFKAPELEPEGAEA